MNLQHERAFDVKKNGVLVCYDCNLPYKDFPLDALVHNDIWELIRAEDLEEDVGILCPNCICRRLRKLGATCLKLKQLVYL